MISGSRGLGILASGLTAAVIPVADPSDFEGGLERAALAPSVPDAKPHRHALHADDQGTLALVRIQARPPRRSVLCPERSRVVCLQAREP